MDGPAGNGAARVTRTGIALVHEGEIVLPAAGSEAQAEQVADDARASIHYFFPVEIEVRAGGQHIDPQQIVDLALERLARSVRAIKV
jgi:hypothetical protein